MEKNQPRTLKAPVLSLRDIVVFPSMVLPLFVGRDKSIAAVEKAMKEDSPLVLLTQKDPALEDPKVKDLHRFGTLATIVQFLRLPDNTVKILVEGKSRVACKKIEDAAFYEADVETIEDKNLESDDVGPLSRALVHEFEHYVKLNKKIPPEVLNAVQDITHASKLADTMAAHLPLSIADKQKILEIDDVFKRLERLYAFIEGEIESIKTENKVRNRVKRQMEKSQREYYLNEQMKAIQKELGESEGGMSEFDEIEEKIKKTKLPKEAKEKARAELKKLRMMSPMAAEASVLRNYLDWLLNVPWKKRSKLQHNLTKAESILNEDHYSLDKVKERILEHLAVQERVGKVPGQILCFVGPPGVGKTSLGRSIAEATGRKFHRIALGGVRDEAEIRGHRRTYIGSQPGKIMQAMRKAGVSNPLILLDEVDKLGADWRGDPTSALLEVLDPEQNQAFGDHYLEVEYDLSDVMFITTANTLNMPQPLLDRMEIIRLSGYTEEEKLQIAKQHLVPKQLKKHGLSAAELKFKEDALLEIVQSYTQEAGVRSFEREIAKVCRKTVKMLIDQKKKSFTVTKANLKDFLGIKLYRHQIAEKEDAIGVSTGLAWTQFGGEMLSIEAVMVPGKGNIKATGKLGDVMQESVQAAASFVRSRFKELGINPAHFKKYDIHIHVPEGATPKDGPSAGIALCTAMASLLTGIPVRKDVAMTGEITLRGHVLPIGGLKEKALAAHRGGIKKILIPEDNKKDIEDLPASVVKELSIVPVAQAMEALKEALTKKPIPLTNADIKKLSETERLAEAGTENERPTVAETPHHGAH